MKRLILWLPLIVLIAFVATVAFRLYGGKDDIVRSQMIGKPVPEFALEAAVKSHPALRVQDLRTGEPRLLNIFASWCAPCAIESPQLRELQRRGIPIDAVAIRDRPEDVAAFLQRYGDSFARIGSDPATQFQFALGSSGVPETFVIDGKGIIRHQHVGYIGPEDLDEITAAYEAAK
ncbi:MAG: redoxin family protein [Sphingosinicella sp.]|nr:redoxin family protein [Sphingosinicella sp.]